jgi:hypothetical protein
VAFRGLVGSSEFCVALIAVERPIWNLGTRRIATEEMENAWAVFAAYKLACAVTRRAEVVAVSLWRVLAFY